MDLIAELLWSPLLAVLYLALGIALLVATGAVAWTHAPTLGAAVWRSDDGSGSPNGISHRHAFISSLAACVGVGNLAGVGTALHLGGPGALFWMWVSAALGMSFRMASAYLARRVGPENEHDRAYATPMGYLAGRGERVTWAAVVAGLLVLAGLVNSNLIQANSVAHTLELDFGWSRWWVAGGLALTTGVVVLGGVRSIVRAGVLLAPWMLAIYLALGLLALARSPLATCASFGEVLGGALGSGAVGGGVAGYTVMQAMQFGVSRGVFSHGSGIGMAPFFQSANDDHPAKSAMMAALVPAVDTLLVCSTTGLVVLTYGNVESATGAHLTVSSFGRALGEPAMLVVAACLGVFAFTTITSWAHFTERCFLYLGGRNQLAYRSLFCAVTFCGPLLPLGPIWSLADILIGALLVTHSIPLVGLMARYARQLDRDVEELVGGAPPSWDHGPPQKKPRGRR